MEKEKLRREVIVQLLETEEIYTKLLMLSQIFRQLIEKIIREIEEIEAVDFIPSKKIIVGSIVVVKKEDGEIERYFILPGGAGIVIAKNTSEKLIIITPKSPIGSALLGKIPGDHCKINTSKKSFYITIVSVE